MDQKKTVSSQEFMQMWVAALQSLQNNIDVVNGLNVFPVPDGDTGTNMHLTLKSAIDNLDAQDTEIPIIASKISKGSLMGARGNSGVILSQILRGFSNALVSKKELDGKSFAEALESGVETAYKAVIKPVEGTILTVCKDSARIALESAEAGNDLLKVMRDTIREASASLERTPDLLPVLKKAGVVDAGGKGLLIIMQGWYKALTGEKVDLEQLIPTKRVEMTYTDGHEDGYGYCTEFMIKANEKHVGTLIKILEEIGDSLVVVGIEDIIKVHVHTLNPGLALEEALKFGELIKIKIDNMQEQHTHTMQEIEPVNTEELEMAVIAVSVGDGISEIFMSMGVNHIIKGGQTMNPSTEDIVSAINKLNAKNVFVLPNNSNIILAAQQSKELVDVNVEVIPSKNIPQGFAAMMGFNPSGEIEEVKHAMIDNMAYVNSAEVTFATRDFQADFGNIKKNDIIGINNGDIIIAGKDPQAVLFSTLEKMIDEDSEVISIFVGDLYEEKIIEELQESIEEIYPDFDVEVHYGGQPLYYYLVSVE
jgi:hypothetical protein